MTYSTAMILLLEKQKLCVTLLTDLIVPSYAYSSLPMPAAAFLPSFLPSYIRSYSSVPSNR